MIYSTVYPLINPGLILICVAADTCPDVGYQLLISLLHQMVNLQTVIGTISAFGVVHLSMKIRGNVKKKREKGQLGIE